MTDFEEIVVGHRDRGKKSALVLTLAVFVVFFALYRGPAEGYWDTYISVPAVLMAGEYVEFLDADGRQAYQYQLEHKLPHDLVRKDSFGIATKDQRIGAAVLAAPFAKLFKLFGFRLLFALVPALTALAFFCLVQRLTGRRWLAFLAAGALVLNPFVLSYQRMNANYTALLIVAALFLVLETNPLRPFVAGLLFGVMGGLRNMAIIYAPILLLWILFRGMEQTRGKPLARKLAGLRGVLLFVGGAFVAILPFMYWKEFAFGSPLAHPSQYPHFQGFRPTFSHSFLGMDFDFNGLLNYPFADSWLRTPHFPFPTFLMIPAVFLSGFGLLLSSFAFLGGSSLFRTNRKMAWYLLAWLAVSCLFWAFQENWEELKMSFLFLALPPFVVFMAFGLERLTIIGGLRRSAAAVLAISLIMVVLLKFSFYLEFPLDERWYQRFPKAATNESGLSGLPEHGRLDPEFFLTRETEDERLREKRRLTSICIFPCRYLPIEPQWDGLLGESASEMGTDTLKVQSVWDTIYAQQDERASQ